MKFDLICKDLNADNVRDVLDLLQPEQKNLNTAAAPAAIVSNPTHTAPYAGVQTDNAENNNEPGDLDANGYPWNEKIHSSNQQKTAKGLWTKKRGVSDELTAQVEAEMRSAGFGQPPAAVQSFQPAAPVMQPFQPAAPVAQPQFQQPAPQPQFHPAAPIAAPLVQQPAPVMQPFQPAPVAPAMTAAPSAPTVQDFSALTARISLLFGQQAITPDYLATLCQRIGAGFNCTINAITDIQTNQAMINYAFDLMRVDGKA